jgi:hypothetical protein
VTLLRGLLSVARRLRLAATQRHRLDAIKSRPADMRDWAVARRKRARHLIELGGLVQKADLVELVDDDRATMLGAFMELADRLRGSAGEVLAISPCAGAVVASGPSMPIRTEKCKALAPAMSVSFIGQKTTEIPLRVTHETAHVPPVLNLLQQAALNAVVAEPQNVSARMTHQNRGMGGNQRL